MAESAAAFTDGTVSAVYVGAAVVGLGVLAAFAIPARRSRAASPSAEAA